MQRDNYDEQYKNQSKTIIICHTILVQDDFEHHSFIDFHSVEDGVDFQLAVVVVELPRNSSIIKFSFTNKNLTPCIPAVEVELLVVGADCPASQR